uniref:EXPERA domain-containing protein n=1 Tax=Anopheles farauti TaxID=69004 RepID=A0A182QZ03_9DIPT
MFVFECILRRNSSVSFRHRLQQDQPIQSFATRTTMNLCSNIKFHGYVIVVFSALLTITVLISSVTLKLIYPNGPTDGDTVPSDLQELADYGWFDFTGDIVHLISIAVLGYGIRKENRFCLIPFLVSIVLDWVAYLVVNARSGSPVPYPVWLVTTALFLYVFVTLIGMYKCFQIKVKEGADRSDEFSKTMCI